MIGNPYDQLTGSNAADLEHGEITADEYATPRDPDGDRRCSSLRLLDQKLGIVRTRVVGVWDGVYPGFYLYGPAGTGKTHIVLETLNRIRSDDPQSKDYVYHRGHLTPMGLFELIDEHHDEILVLDDVHLLFEQPLSQQLLLAALGNPINGVRVVKYKRQGYDRETAFRGGVICISNLDLLNGGDDPVLEALSSRTHIVRYAPSDGEMEGLIRELASRGWQRSAGEQVFRLQAAQCEEVANFLIPECRARGRRLDLRLYLEKALPDFCHCENGETEVEWRDLIRSTLDQEVIQPEFTAKQQFAVSRQARKDQELALVADILAEHAEPESRVAAWVFQTGKCKRSFYRRLKELELQ